jgi:hypothetical protein
MAARRNKTSFTRSQRTIEGGAQGIVTSIISRKSPRYTDAGLREATRTELAKLIVWGIFLSLGSLFLFLFILIILGKEQAQIFKEILLSFIGFASGILVTVFGFYFKSRQNGGEDGL